MHKQNNIIKAFNSESLFQLFLLFIILCCIE